MPQTNIDILNSFDLTNIPSLDIAVLGALEMLASREVPSIDISSFKRPLVVGSGNAEATGRIIFGEKDAIFASESTVDEKLANIADIDGVVIVSASGGKHAPIIAEKAHQAGKFVMLITNTPNSPTEQALSKDELTTHVFPKNREPYTYNTSTYMSMIAGWTGEDSVLISRFISDEIDTLNMPDFSKFDKYYLIVPPRFAGVIRMLQIKFVELFGREIARDIETSEYVRHATTVVPDDNTLFIAFGDPNSTWGQPENRLNIPLPNNVDYLAMVAVGYYIVAQIQNAKPQYFKQNIEQYCQFISEIFNENINPIVDGTT